MEDSHPRRRLIQLFGVSAISSLAGCGSILQKAEKEIEAGRSSSTSTKTEADGTTPTDVGVTNYLDSELRDSENLVRSAITDAEFQFTDEELSLELDSPDAGIDRIEAKPDNASEGDILRFLMGSTPASELTTMLRLVWDIADSEISVETAIEGQSLELTGGPGLEFAALIGVLPGDSTSVIVVRADSVIKVENIAKSLDG